MERYGLIIEWKDEPATLMECQINRCDGESVAKRMREAVRDPRVIRVAMVKLEYVRGHDHLLEDDRNNETPF